jgi:hypothetical protein
LSAGDQSLNDQDLIGKTTLNVLEPGGDREIIVEEKQSYIRHERVGFRQEVARLG